LNVAVLDFEAAWKFKALEESPGPWEKSYADQGESYAVDGELWPGHVDDCNNECSNSQNPTENPLISVGLRCRLTQPSAGPLKPTGDGFNPSTHRTDRKLLP
jgi:hypothetical protein